MKSKKVNKNIIMMIIVLFITLGYAYLNSELKINGTTGIAGNTWDIHFENVVPSSSNTVTPTIAPVANPSDKVTELTYSVLFNKPGDVYEFDVDIVNAGSIDAMVNLITSTIKISDGEEQELNDSTLPSYLNYYVKYSDGIKINKHHLLNKESRETIKVHIEYKVDISEEDLTNSAGKTIEFTYEIQYIQADDSGKPRVLANNCTYSGELVQGAEYVNGQYTYRYMQEKSDTGWDTISLDGWGVAITDVSSTDDVTTRLCSSINGKPIVSMQNMFKDSLANSIDVSSFDTSNVVNIKHMFNNADSITELNLSGFDTSNLVNIRGFVDSTDLLESLNMNDWDFTKVARVDYLLAGSGNKLEYLSAKRWKAKVDFSRVFIGQTSLKTVDLHDWDLSNTTSISSLFQGCKISKYNGINTWDTSNIQKMSSIFYSASNGVENLDFEITNWDVSNVTSMAEAFKHMGSYSTKVKFVLKNFNINENATSYDLIRYVGSGARNIEFILDNVTFGSSTSTDYMLEGIGSSSYDFKASINSISFPKATKLTNLFWNFGGGAYTNVSVTNLKAPVATNAGSTFYNFLNVSGGLELNLKVEDWEIPNVTSTNLFLYRVGRSFQNVNIKLSNIDTSNVTSMNYMFNEVGVNSQNVKLDFSGLNTSNVTSMSNMFYGFGSGSQSIEVNGLNDLDLRKVTNMAQFMCDASAIPIGTLDIYADNIGAMFSSSKVIGTINLHKKPTTFDSALYIKPEGELTVNYSSEVDNIDQIIATANGNPKVIKGNVIN